MNFLVVIVFKIGFAIELRGAITNIKLASSVGGTVFHVTEAIEDDDSKGRKEVGESDHHQTNHNRSRVIMAGFPYIGSSSKFDADADAQTCYCGKHNGINESVNNRKREGN